MTTEVANKASGALAALGSLRAGLQNVQQTAKLHTAGGDPILKLQTDGKWCYGAENIEIEAGMEWAVNPLSARHGYICFKARPQGSREKAELYGRHVYPATQQLPPVESLQAYDSDGEAIDHKKHPWSYFAGVDMKCTKSTDPDEVGEQVVYEPTSDGGKRAMADLMGKIEKQIDKDIEHPVAVLELASDFYNNKTHGGRTYFPVLNVLRWVGMMDDPTAAAAPAAEQPKPKAAVVKQVVAQADNDEEETAAPAPAAASEGGTRRRRRVA